MLAFGENHTYRRPPKGDPNAPQPVPSIRELMGLPDNGPKEDEDPHESMDLDADPGLSDLKRKRKESMAVGEGYDVIVIGQQHVPLGQIDESSHKLAKLSVADAVLQI